MAGGFRARTLRVNPRRLRSRLEAWRERIPREPEIATYAQIAAAPPLLRVQRFRLLTEHEDWLRCQAINPAEGGVQANQIVAIAKPHELRGDVATRTVNGEAQEILPAYAAAGYLFAIWVPNGTGATLVVAGTRRQLYWQDLNTGGRAWAESV